MKSFIEQLRDLPIAKSFSRFQSSISYPIIFAIICVISSSIGRNIYIPCMWVLTFFVSFGLIFNPDTRPFLAPFFMIFYALGSDPIYFVNNPSQGILQSVNKGDLVQMLIMASVILSALFLRLHSDGRIKELFMQKNHFIFGLMLFNAALLLNGAFSLNANFENFLYGGLTIVGITVSYIALRAVLPKTENTVEYLCYTALCFGYMVLAQFAIRCVTLFREGNLFKLSESGRIIGISETWLVLPWGVSNMIGAAVIMAVPSAIYLAYSKKNGIVYYLSAFAFVLTSFFTMGRTSMLFGALFLLFGIVICTFFRKNNFPFHIANVSILLALGCLFLIYCLTSSSVSQAFLNLLDILKLTDLDGSERSTIWKYGLSDFLSAPIFGIGLVNPYGNVTNDYCNMYHNIIIQILASLGIFGFITFAYHIKDLTVAVFKDFSIQKFILFLTPALVLAMSLFDNFFFYLNFQMIYAAFLAAIELEKSRAEITLNTN